MNKLSFGKITCFVAGLMVLAATPFAAHAQATAQNPGNVVNTGTNAFSYLVMEGESYVDSSKVQDPSVGFTKLYNDEALTSFYGGPMLATNTGASMQGALGTVGPSIGLFGDKVTYQVVFSRPGDYYTYMRFTMFENGGNTNLYGNEDSFFFPPDFNKDPQTDWDPPGSSGANDGGYIEGCCDGRGFLYILDYQGNGTRTDYYNAYTTNGTPLLASTNWEGKFHWNQLFSSQFLNPAIGAPGVPFHYVVTPAMVGIPQNFTIAYREQGVTIDLFLFSTHTNMMNDYTQSQLDDLFVKKVAVQQAENKVVTPTNTYPFLTLEAENYMAKTNRDTTRGFGAITVGSTNISFYGAPMLATNTGASGKGALATQNPLGSFSDFISYRVQFQTPGDYYLYMRFTMFENGGNTNVYGNEDSFYVPPDFNQNPMTDWVPAGAPGVNDGGYCEGCCDGRGFLYILDYQGGGTRTDYYNAYTTNGTPLLAATSWEGKFHWNQLFSSQFLNPATQGVPGVPFHYVVTPGEVGVTMNWTIACREPGVTPDVWLFSTHTNLLNDYTQAQLDQQYLSPQLTISSSGGNLIVSWPVSASTFILESTTSLTSPIWTAVDQGAALAGSRWNLTVAAPAGTKYFRLKQS
jgi:hypothetical protein